MEDYVRPDVFDHPDARNEHISFDTFRDNNNVRIEAPVVFDTASGGIADTSFTTTPTSVKDVFTTDGLTLDQQNTAGAAKEYYRMLAEDQGLRPEVPNLSSFVVDGNGRLRLEGYPDMNLINERTGRPNKLTTIADHRGGRGIVRKELGFSSWTPQMSKAVEAALRKANLKLGVATKSLDTAGETEAVKSAKKIVAVLTREGYTSRDILGMCRALERSREEHTNNLAKLSELDEHIALEERKLEEAPDETTKDRIAERLRKLQDERAARLEAASTTREALRSQISRMRETLHRILHEDKTLAERIKTLFREQGVTIASILTAIGMTISTIVLALTGGSGGGTSPPQPPHPPGKGGAKEWLKKHLQSLGRILAKLAGKAAAALRGIIGRVDRFLAPVPPGENRGLAI